MTDAEWRRLTPRMLAARMERHRKDQRRSDLVIGEAVAAIYNVNRARGQKVLRGSDIFPDPFAKPKRASRAALRGSLRALRAHVDSLRERKTG